MACNHRGMAIMGQKSDCWQCIASRGCPARDVISNVRKGAHAVIRNCVRHIPGFISGCALISGSLFVAPATRALNTPPASEPP